MKTYLECYRERLIRNNDTFIGIAAQLKERGCQVYVPKDQLISFIYAEKDSKHIYFGFAEVPYHFYLSYNIDYKLNQGSGRTLKEIYSTENPFSIEDILNSLQPNVKTLISNTTHLQSI